MFELVPYFIYFSLKNWAKFLASSLSLGASGIGFWLVASSDFTDQFEQFSDVIGIGFDYSV